MAEEKPQSLINLGDLAGLAEPAKVLIEKISEAVGGVFKPQQIRRVAQAEADADKIKALAQIEITDLQRRGLVRLVGEEAQKQENIEKITQKALPQLESTANPAVISRDWLTEFFDKARLFSEEEMQNLWSRILAGEANNPGSFSKRTLSLVASLEKEDAAVFKRLCCFSATIGDFVAPIVFDTEENIYKNNKVFFSSLTHLDSIGLIRFESVEGYARRGLKEKVVAAYFDETMDVEFVKGQDNKLSIGWALFTVPGQELSKICGASKIENFSAYLKSKWKEAPHVKSVS